MQISELLKDLRYRIEYAGLRLITGLVRAAPMDVSVKVSGKIWRLVAPYDRRHQRALANLAIAFPDMPASEREAIALAMWENLGRVMAETMQIDRIIKDPKRIEIADERLYGRYKDKLGPAIGVTLHMGNWELAIWPFTMAGNNPAAVYRTVKNPYVDRYLKSMRQNLYPGGLLGRVCDLHDRTGIPVPFFGRPAKSVAIPAMIARRVGARIWMARCLRLGSESRFRIELKELKVPRSPSQADDVRWITAEMQKQFETWVRQHPEQWMWSNRRWS